MLGFKILCSGSFKKNAKLLKKLSDFNVTWREDSSPAETQAPPDYVLCVIKDKVGSEVTLRAFIRLDPYGLCHLKTVSSSEVIAATSIEDLYKD